jgi:signal transduction histidine kinase
VKAISRISLGVRGFGILAIISIIISSYALFFYLQRETQEQVKSQLFEAQRERQLTSTKQITDHIGSDLTLILSFLDGVSNSKYLQEGKFYDKEIRQLAMEKYAQMSETVDRLFILDSQNVVVVGVGNLSSATGSIAPVGNDLSFRPWVSETRNMLKPVFSEGFEHLGGYRVIITNPVIDRDTKHYLGLVGVSIPTVPFFEHYGNVHDVNSQFLVAYDRKGTLLAVGANESLVGLDFFGATVQNFIDHNPTLNKHTAELLQGNGGYVVFDAGRGERLQTYQPIYVAGAPTYFLQVVTPTTTIYSEIASLLSRENAKMTLLLGGSTGASALLIIFLVLWNSSLEKEVKKRTKDLEESNRLLEVTNEQLKDRERMQNDFINIAAHEMRTPIQPILGLSEVIRERISNIAKQLQRAEGKKVVYEQLEDRGSAATGSSQRDLIDVPSAPSSSIEKIVSMADVINRNAKRLEKLTDNLLDVSRIENSKSVELSKELFPIDSLIRDCIIDASQHIGKKNLKFSHLAADDNRQLIIKADRGRIAQVIMNLLDNSIKFSEDGVINVTATIDADANSLMVSVKDSGSGISPEIIPRLFSKFITTSEKGTGLGLYISKKIIEAHDGRIWAENNQDGKGTTFTFTLPLLPPSSYEALTTGTAVKT